jgi:hypothetical protein
VIESFEKIPYTGLASESIRCKIAKLTSKGGVAGKDAGNVSLEFPAGRVGY